MAFRSFLKKLFSAVVLSFGISAYLHAAEPKPFIQYMADRFQILTPDLSQDELVAIWMDEMKGTCKFGDDQIMCDMEKLPFPEFTHMWLLINPRSTKFVSLVFSFDDARKVKGIDPELVLMKLPFKEGTVRKNRKQGTVEVNCPEGYYRISFPGGSLFSVSRVVRPPEGYGGE